MLVYLNGRFVDRASASVPIDDRGFLFGDGVYEVLRVVQGRLVEPARHWARLARGLAGLRIRRPDELDDRALGAIAHHLLADNGLTDGEALVYLEITRGAAPRTHHFPPPDTSPTVLMSVGAYAPPHALRERGTAVITVPDQRWARCDLKTINLLPNALAKQLAVDAGVHEAVFVRDGVVTEGSSSNIFALVDGELRTYPASNYILSGITRDVVLDIAGDLGLTVRTFPILAAELPAAEEVFLTSTTNDVMPVTSVDGARIGDGRPGPVTMRLYQAFAAAALHRPSIAV